MSKQDRFAYIALIASAKCRALARASHLSPAQQTRIARRLCRA